MGLLVDRLLQRNCWRFVGDWLSAATKEVTGADTGFMDIDAAVAAWAAVFVVAEHAAAIDMQIAVADIGLDVAGHVDRGAGHEGVAEAPAAAATMDDFVVAPAAVISLRYPV